MYCDALKCFNHTNKCNDCIYPAYFKHVKYFVFKGKKK